MSQTARQAWREVVRAVGDELLTNPAAHALWHVGERLYHELTVENHELRAELAAQRGVTVLLCMERDMATARDVAAADADEGTVLRATDTGREWVFTAGAWLERELA